MLKDLNRTARKIVLKKNNPKPKYYTFTIILDSFLTMDAYRKLKRKT